MKQQKIPDLPDTQLARRLDDIIRGLRIRSKRQIVRYDHILLDGISSIGALKPPHRS